MVRRVATALSTAPLVAPPRRDHSRNALHNSINSTCRGIVCGGGGGRGEGGRGEGGKGEGVGRDHSMPCRARSTAPVGGVVGGRGGRAKGGGEGGRRERER